MNWPKAPVSPRCRRRCAATLPRELHDRMAKRFRKLRKTRCPANWPTALPAASPTSSTSTVRTTLWTRPAPRRWRRSAAAVEGLVANDFDVAVTGGIDRNMGAPTFVKFCKIGALSATGTRPYAEGADGFVMGEGAAIFLLKRLADAERDGDKIYAVLRGIGGSSDGKGKGITAPNPIGQKLCHRARLAECRIITRYRDPDRRPRHVHRVGDVVEVQSMVDVLSSSNLPPDSVALGSVKSNIGHLKGAAGAAGLLKAALALRDKVLPPSVHCERPQSRHRFCPLSALRQYRAEAVDRAGRWRAPRRSERLWFWRHKLPRRARRIHSPQAERKRQAVGSCQ